MDNTLPATYVYCLVAAARRPPLGRVPRGHKGMGRVRLLDVSRGLWLAVADAPLDLYGEAAISRGLGDLDWVSRAAVAHEAVVESFTAASAVIPMKLFTIFTSDARAVEHVSADRVRIDAVLKRITGHLEWGVRVMPGRPAAPVEPKKARTAAVSSGAAFLARKKTQRDAAIELAARGRAVVEDLYQQLAAESRLARRRTASELSSPRGPLLLDAAFLVPKTRALRFEKRGAKAARDLARQGYRVIITGPWPAYSFIQE